MLEFLLRGPDEVLLLDEPDNFLDVPGKTWLEDRINESAEDDPLHQPRPGAARTTPPPGWSPSSSAPPATPCGRIPGGFATYHEARRERFAPLRGAAQALGRGARQAARADADVQAEGGLQLRHGLALPGRGDPAAEVRGGRAAAGPPARAAGDDAAARRPHRQARGDLRAARAHRADEAVRPRGLVRRAGGRARLQRLRQVALPAAARRRRHRPRRRAPAGGGGAGQAGRPHRPGPARRAGAAGLVRADPRAPGADRAARCWRSCTAATTTGTGCRASRPPRALDRYELAHAAEQRFESLSGGQQARFQILLLELSGRPCCCSTSRPTTSTWSPPRRWRRGWRRSRARWSR